MAVKGGINHITLRVKNMARSAEYYVDLLGLEKIGQRPGMQFFSSGTYNHELALVEDPRITEEAISRGGLLHIGFNVENETVLAELYQKVIDAGYPVSKGIDHNISRSFYTKDPDGYQVEITTDVDKAEWDSDENAFLRDGTFEIGSKG